MPDRNPTICVDIIVENVSFFFLLQTEKAVNGGHIFIASDYLLELLLDPLILCTV